MKNFVEELRWRGMLAQKNYFKKRWSQHTWEQIQRLTLCTSDTSVVS